MPAPITYSTTGSALSSDEIAFAHQVAASFSIGMRKGWPKTVRREDQLTGAVVEYHADKNLAYVTPGGFVCGYATDIDVDRAVTWGVSGTKASLLKIPDWADSSLAIAGRKNTIAGIVINAAQTVNKSAMWVGRSIKVLEFLSVPDKVYGVSTDGKFSVGASIADDVVFIWGIDDTISYLPVPAGGLARAVSASDNGAIVVGFAVTTNLYPAYWSDGNLNILVDIPPEGPGVANGVSSDGTVIVGRYINSSGFDDAFRWTAATGMVRILTVVDADVEAVGVSSDGTVVVGTVRYNFGDEAFIWTTSSGSLLLGVGSNANGVSSDGKIIVGISAGKPVRWTVSGEMTELFPPDGFSRASAIGAS